MTTATAHPPSAASITPMAEPTQTVAERLEEIGTQLAWVRDYL
jgi:hypothetical protein